MIDRSVDRHDVLGLAASIVDRPAPHDKHDEPEAQDAAAGEKGAELLRASVRAAQPVAPRVMAPRAERTAFMPRDRNLALVQALHEERVATAPDAAVRTSETPAGPLASQTVAPPEQYWATRLRRFLLDYVPGGAQIARLLGRHYHRFAEGLDVTHNVDPQWFTQVLAAVGRYGLAREAFRRADATPTPQPLGDPARVILVGDWGTGEDLAQQVADRIGKWLENPAGGRTHVVHLGDVYYAGTPWEAEHRFLAHWPVPPGDTRGIGSWCLNGNHDMYAAATGLTEKILADPRFAAQKDAAAEPGTEFLLRNEHWQVIGLDTAWKFRTDDPSGQAGYLDDEQARWLASCRADAAGRGTVLLSHHQPFKAEGRRLTAFGNLMEQTAALRADPGVAAWFWGHEHRLMTYAARDGVDYGACVGHGAIPVAHDAKDPDVPGETRFRDTFTDREGDTWYKPGFTVLDLDGPLITVRYIAEDGTEWESQRHILKAPSGGAAD